MAVVDDAYSATAAETADVVVPLRGHKRGWVVRRALMCADLIGLMAAFTIAEFVFGRDLRVGVRDHVAIGLEFMLFFLTLPGWIVIAKLYGLYERDEERADHSTVDDLTGIFHLVTVGAWLVFIVAWLSNLADPRLPKLITFWGLAIVLVTLARAIARARVRASASYIQNTLIVGAGDVGQLIARKLQLHPEYGIRVVGFIDPEPRERREDIGDLCLLGEIDDLESIVRENRIDRVIVAFSAETHERLLHYTRSLRDMGVQIDLVPRLFEAVGPRAGLHTVEGLPLLGLPPVRLSRSSMLLKRAVDIVVSSAALVLLSPLYAYLALRVKLDSPGPVLFRQTRLGLNRREFTMLKFRTMYVDTDENHHRELVTKTMSSKTPAGSNGLFKLENSDSITPFGRVLRRSSLDELPQFVNVLRGEMSLVGPRPCIPYEVEHFAPHQFDRFLVPQGLTGLWQVTARSRAPFGEALEMDAAYARGWSLWLDLQLLFRTPLAVIRQRGAV